MNNENRLTFIGKVHYFDSHKLASYVPKLVIDFHEINIQNFRGASWHDDQYYYRASSDDKWKRISGYLGLYSSRKTLRLLFSAYGDKLELVGKTVEFCIRFHNETVKTS